MRETILSLEEIDRLVFDAQGLIPVVVQEARQQTVLMLAYANKEAVTRTLSTGRAYYFSRSRQCLWQKGETSGHTQAVTAVYFDCDRDALLYKVTQTGVACHTGRYSCFGEEPEPRDPLRTLQETVIHRRDHPQEGSYTNYLLDKGLDKILKKVGEENAEVIIAAKNADSSELCYETADLLYHMSVLLTARGLDWQAVYQELERRRGAKA